MLCEKSKTLFTIFTTITLLISTAIKQTVITAYYNKNMTKLKESFLKLTKKDVKARPVQAVSFCVCEH